MRLMFLGDLVLDAPDPDHWLSGLSEVLSGADLAIGHLEVPHTTAGVALESDVPAPGADPAHLAAVSRAGVQCVTLAGNHIADCGADGIRDTIASLEQYSIAHCGAAETLNAARRPAFLSAQGSKLAVLSYNCIGPQDAWAQESAAGCSFLPMDTSDGAPITPLSEISGVGADASDILRNDIAAARASGASLVIVALHKGVVHTPVLIADYERAAARLAIEAGADIVVGHHAHIARGIEFHQGKPIFHGLGNGCVVTTSLGPGQDHPARAAWVERRKKLFGFEPDPAYSLAPFHPEAVNGLVGVVDVGEGGALSAGFIPLFVEPPGRPVLAEGARWDAVSGYIADITEKAGLAPLAITRSGDVARVTTC